MYLTRKNNSMMPSLFNDLFNWDGWNTMLSNESTTMPKINISESDADYRMELCVPGLSKEDLNISVDTDNNLVIEMVKKEEKKETTNDDRRFLRKEFSEMQFKQMFSLPENVKKEQIAAKVENGVLSVTLPKFTAEEKRQLAQTIEIQ